MTYHNPSSLMPAATEPHTPSTTRTLVLAPPSAASHPDTLENVLASYDRSVTDMQMLDRLSLSLVSLPDSNYDIVLLLADTSPRTRPLHHFLSKNVFHQLFQSLRPGGRIQLDGDTTQFSDGCRTEAVLSGFVFSKDGLLKPSEQATQSVPFRARKPASPKATTKLAGTGAVTLNLNGKRMNGPPLPAATGVGFEDPTDELSSLGLNGTISDDELIDEDTLLEEEDMQRPIVQRV